MIFNCHRASYRFRIRCTLFQKMAGRSDKPYSLVKTRVWLWLSLASFYDSRVSCSNTWNYFCQKVLVPMQSKNGRNGVAWCGVQKSNWCDFSHSLAVRLTEEIAFAKRQWLDFSGVDEFAKLQPISFVVVVHSRQNLLVWHEHEISKKDVPKLQQISCFMSKLPLDLSKQKNEPNFDTIETKR